MDTNPHEIHQILVHQKPRDSAELHASYRFWKKLEHRVIHKFLSSVECVPYIDSVGYICWFNDQSRMC